MEIEKKVDKEDSIYKTKRRTYNFRRFKRLKPFARNIYNYKTTVYEAEKQISI